MLDKLLSRKRSSSGFQPFSSGKPSDNFSNNPLNKKSFFSTDKNISIQRSMVYIVNGVNNLTKRLFKNDYSEYVSLKQHGGKGPLDVFDEIRKRNDTKENKEYKVLLKKHRILGDVIYLKYGPDCEKSKHRPEIIDYFRSFFSTGQSAKNKMDEREESEVQNILNMNLSGNNDADNHNDYYSSSSESSVSDENNNNLYDFKINKNTIQREASINSSFSNESNLCHNYPTDYFLPAGSGTTGGNISGSADHSSRSSSISSSQAGYFEDKININCSEPDYKFDISYTPVNTQNSNHQEINFKDEKNTLNDSISINSNSGPDFDYDTDNTDESFGTQILNTSGMRKINPKDIKDGLNRLLTFDPEYNMQDIE